MLMLSDTPLEPHKALVRYYEKIMQYVISILNIVFIVMAVLVVSFISHYDVQPPYKGFLSSSC